MLPARKQIINAPLRISLIYAAVAGMWILLSDRLLEWLFTDSAIISRMQTFKGSAFVLVTTVLLYFLANRYQSHSSPQPPKTSHSHRLMPLLVFVLFGCTVCTTGWFVFSGLRASIKQEAQQHLNLVANLKADQINIWLHEHYAATGALSRDSALAREIFPWLQSGGHDTRKRADILRDFDGFLRVYHYRAMALYDSNGKLILSAGNLPPNLESHGEIARRAIASRKQILVDLHREEKDASFIQMGIMSPLTQGNRSVSALYFAIDPGKHFFPLLRQRGGNNNSLETFLVRQQNERVLFLSELRFRKDPALTFSLPFAGNDQLASVAGLRGRLGLAEGLHDYRGVDVLSEAAAIPDTPWLVVSKIDQAEAYSATYRVALIAGLLTLLFLNLSGTAVWLWWRHEREHLELVNKQAELERAALVRHYDYLSKYANDIILLIDQQGNIAEANEHAEQVYGYTHQELIGMPYVLLHAPNAREQCNNILQNLRATKSVQYEAVHQHKNGHTFPTEPNIRAIEENGQFFFHAVIRDISERKVQEASIQRLSKLYQALSAANHSIVHMPEETELLPMICHIIVQLGGMQLAWIGKLDETSGLIEPVANYGNVEYLEGLIISGRKDVPEGCGPTGTALRENRIVVVNDYQTDTMTIPWRERAASYNLGSAVTFPILRAGKPYAVLSVYSEQTGTFDAEIITLLEEMAHDISFTLDNHDRETQRLSLEEQLKLNAQVFEAGREGIVITNADNIILSVNHSFTEITGYTKQEAVGKTPRLLKSDRHHKSFFIDMWQSILADGHWQGEIWNRRNNGEIYPAWLSVTAVKDANGHITKHIGIFTDITNFKAAEEKIHVLAHYDTLTNLPNRALLEDRMKLSLAAAQRDQSKVTLMFLDLDRFKNVNDSLGHLIGDRLLQQLAIRLTSLLREEDTVSRLGGDEFILVLPGTDAQGAAHVAEKLLETIAQPYHIDTYELNLTGSVGIAQFPENGDNLDALSQCADSALYRAKQSGRNNFQFFTQEMQDRVHEVLRIESHLRRALEKNELLLYYQPQVETTSSEIVGVEALLRWNHPEFGMVPPATFIPIAEDSGQIREIGDWVLHTALQQNAQWQAAGLPIVPVAVNISLAQFLQKTLLSTVLNALHASGQEPAMLELELTESIAMEDFAFTVATVDSLSQIGVTLSVDDFGTGYSSLSYLKRFKINKLKIDQSFVRDISDDPDDRAIVIAIIQLAKSLGFKVIAEGVETQEQIDFLRSQQCDQIQGYYFSQPVAADEFARLLQKGKKIAGATFRN